MKFRNSIFFVLTLLIFANCIKAQAANEILDKYFAAIGGLAKFDSIKTETLDAYREMNGVKETIKITTEGNALWREDVVTKNGIKI